MSFNKITILLLCLAVAFCANNLHKMVVEDPEALCLDGTRAVYYAHQGTHPTKFILNFEGGGWCGSDMGLDQTLDDCVGRSKTDLGSSTHYPNVLTQYQGILSDNAQNQFRDHSIFHLKYCDGTGHQGYHKLPINHKGTNLYFRGHSVTKGQLQSINNHFGLWTKATEVIVTGQSAGGLAAMLWTNYISERVHRGTKVWSVPDSGIFLDYQNYNTHLYPLSRQFINFMHYSNTQVGTPINGCDALNRGHEYRCLFAEHIYGLIKVPLFAIQSLYDSWSIQHILGIYCEEEGSLSKCNSQQRSYIQNYHSKTSSVLTAIGGNSANGYWAPSCSNHVYTTVDKLYNSHFRVPQYSEFSAMHSVSLWHSGTSRNNRHIDAVNWPGNQPCSNIKLVSLQTD